MEKTTTNLRLQELHANANQTINMAVEYLHANGIDYHLGEWVTIKKYCEKFNIKNIETVSNWINRGIIPDNHIVVIPALNNLKLIKAVKYLD